MFRPPPGSWQAPLGNQIDPRVSADAVDVRNGLHQSARPQADVDKKTEFSLLKKRSEILVHTFTNDDLKNNLLFVSILAEFAKMERYYLLMQLCTMSDTV